MEAVNRRADELVRRGFQQADRRMLYSARLEFIAALQVIARALDDMDTNQHSAALAAGLRALEEADSFIPQGSALASEVNVELLAAGHQTPVLKSRAAGVTALGALQQYYTYAQEQLAASVQGMPSGSTALYGLGKLYAEIAREPESRILDPQPKVMVFQQAALMANPGNWRAANELGVLLARGGRYEEAREWLRHSVAVKPTRESLNNLGKVYQCLGQRQEAVAAQRRALAAAPGTSFDQEPVSPVQWVDPATFVAANAAVSSQSPDATPAGIVRRPTENDAVSPSGQTSSDAKSGKQWLAPWKSWK